MRKKYTYTATSVPEFSGMLKSLSPLTRELLGKRGYDTDEKAAEFLFGNLAQELDAVEMADTRKAVEILIKHIHNKNHIVIYQDYDVDGCAAGAVCLESLRALSCTADGYMNEREKDGYGICRNGIDHILQLYPNTKLILTVDNGIVACEAVRYAKILGLDVIVTDHHLPGEMLPEADAVIDPKRTDEFYPFHELCGTGVAFKLMLALYDAMGRDATPVLNTLDIVALATVADVVPLVGENRDLVREGLRMMNAGSRPAFRIMKDVLKVDDINAHYTIAYLFAPMINSLSRMGEDPMMATRMLISSDEGELRKNIEFFKELNDTRKEETKQEEEIALSLLPDEKDIPSGIVIYSPDFKEGIIGIVAGRLANKFHRPTVVFAPAADGMLKASCRSIDAFPLKDSLDKISELLVGYGGHAKAAGLTIRTEDLDKFRAAFLAMTDQLDQNVFNPVRELDAIVKGPDISVDQIKELRILEPYGEGNSEPLFGLMFHPDSVRFMGSERQHVKYWVRESNLSVIEWNGGEKERIRQTRNKVRGKVVGRLELNEFNGSVSPQFIVSE